MDKDRKELVNRIMIAGGLLLGAVIMAVISWIILPDAVLVQFSGMQTGLSALPKFFAVLIAFAFSAGFAVASVKQEEGVKYAFIGYALHILYWICNL